MLQFNIYRSAEEQELFWNDYLILRDFLGKFNTAHQMMVNHNQIIYHLEKHQSQRYLLIASKLFSWGVLPEDFSINYLNKNLPILNSNSLSYWELQELVENFKSLNIKILSDLHYKYNLNCELGQQKDKLALQISDNPQQFIVYKPIRSGFFSIIENIILARSVLLTLGYNIVVDDSYEWWPYPVSFKTIFKDSFNYLSDGDLGAVNFVDLGFVRTELLPKLLLQHEYIQKLIVLKSFFYEQIYYDISNYLPLIFNGNHFNQSLSIFIRMGDKIEKEILQMPVDLIIEDATKHKYNDIYILGDHFGIGEIVANELKGINLINKDMKGYNINEIPKINGFHEMLKFYLIASNTKHVISSASINLVNASLWTSQHDRSYRSSYKTCKIHRYLIN
jgi:hypothetical protein